MRRGIAGLLALLMLCALLSGCGGREGPVSTPEHAPASTPEQTPDPTPEPTPDPTPEPDRDLSWARAFRDETLPEGGLSPEEIAFCFTDEEENSLVVNVSRDELLAWWNDQETLPRSSYYEQFMPESLHELYPALDYAMAHGCSRFCIPSTGFTPTDVAVGKKCLKWMYRVNNRVVSAESCGCFDLGEGRTLQYILVTLQGMDAPALRNEYREAISRAREIVAGIPDGSSDSEKILYLYSWLTEHVSYDFDEYYESEWNLLYDTLVKNKTVCAGYAEALYVLSNLAGIECITIRGSVNSGQGWARHIWNAAKIDGEYYQFDATWDTGLPPEQYCFFGVSESTMQLYYPRLIQEPPEEYRPSCTKDLPIPGAPAIAADLAAGMVEGGVYSQPFADLTLSWDDSWTVYSREEINEACYAGTALSLEQCFRLGIPYWDLILERGREAVEITLEQSPATVFSGAVCDSPEGYMDELGKSLQADLEEIGFSRISCRRFQEEIGGRSYECVAVTGRSVGYSFTQITRCTMRDGTFLVIDIFSENEERCGQLLQELLRVEPGL